MMRKLRNLIDTVEVFFTLRSLLKKGFISRKYTLKEVYRSVTYGQKTICKEK